MNFMISANTDIGTTKQTNQDSLSIKVIRTRLGRMVFGVLCDGMGGLSSGEIASATLVNAFSRWAVEKLPDLCGQAQIEDCEIRRQWEEIITEQNEKIKAYGAKQGVRLGTTVVAMLLTQSRYYILNVGDSRAYEIADSLRQLTADQTFVAREVALGNMTEEEAGNDERRNVLLQCVGASDEVYPDMFYGDVKKDAVYLLCSDGFRHEITPEEIYQELHPSQLFDEQNMKAHTKKLIDLNKQRDERDNISAALVRTF